MLYSLTAIDKVEEKLTIGQRWEKLLKDTQAKLEQKHKEAANVALKLPPQQEALLKNLSEFNESVEWTIDHMVWNFTLPTSYEAVSKGDGDMEEVRIRIPIDTRKVHLIGGYKLRQLEDVLEGWMAYIEDRLKTIKEKVGKIILIPSKLFFLITVLNK